MIAFRGVHISNIADIPQICNYIRNADMNELSEIGGNGLIKTRFNEVR